MSFFDRFRKRQAAPSTKRRKVRDQPGPLTVLEAWAIAHPDALQLDREAKLTFITSGLDLSAGGRSFTWEFSFVLPSVRGRALLTVAPSPDTEDVDGAPLYLEERVRPATDEDLKKARALPERFRDSPEVAGELSGQGVDFVAGPGDMKLEARYLHSGDPAWVTYYWDEERFVRFEA